MISPIGVTAVFSARMRFSAITTSNARHPPQSEAWSPDALHCAGAVFRARSRPERIKPRSIGSSSLLSFVTAISSPAGFRWPSYADILINRQRQDGSIEGDEADEAAGCDPGGRGRDRRSRERFVGSLASGQGWRRKKEGHCYGRWHLGTL